MSRVTPKIALVLVVFLLLVNIPLIISGIFFIRTGTYEGMGLIWYGLIFIIDFFVLVLISQLQTTSYVRVV